MKGQSQTLMGLDWLKHIQLKWPDILKVLKVEQKTVAPVSDVVSEFEEIFTERHGTVKKHKGNLSSEIQCNTQVFLFLDLFHLH